MMIKWNSSFDTFIDMKNSNNLNNSNNIDDLIMDLIFDFKPSLCFFIDTWLHSFDISTNYPSAVLLFYC